MFDPCPGLSQSLSWSVPVLVSPHLFFVSWSLPICPCCGLYLFSSLPISSCPGLSLSLSLSWSLPDSVLGLGSRLSGRLGRSESLRVSDRRRPSRGSLGAKGRGGGRSRSDVDMNPSSATAVLGPARRATYVTPTPHPPNPLSQPGEAGKIGEGLLPESQGTGYWMLRSLKAYSGHRRGVGQFFKNLGAGLTMGHPGGMEC